MILLTSLCCKAQKWSIGTGVEGGFIAERIFRYQGEYIGPSLLAEYAPHPLVRIGIRTALLQSYRNTNKRDLYVPIQATLGYRLTYAKNSVGANFGLGVIYKSSALGPAANSTDFAFSYGLVYGYQFKERVQWQSRLNFNYAFASEIDGLFRQDYYMLGLLTGLVFTL